MGRTAENVARLHAVTRAEQDEFAARSHQLTQTALALELWAREITPVELPKGATVTADDGPRRSVTVESLGRLAPASRPDGTVTAGNCCR